MSWFYSFIYSFISINSSKSPVVDSSWTDGADEYSYDVDDDYDENEGNVLLLFLLLLL